MAPKKDTTTTASKAKSNHASYQDMITYGITTLKERNGSSRQALKKFVKANNAITVTEKMFDSLFNKALKSGVEKGVFEQPKGPSGPVKLSKKTKEVKPVGKDSEKPAAKKAAAPKKEGTTTKKAAPKKAAAPKKTAAAAAKKEEKPAATKTKTGRVTKTAKAPATKKAPVKKAAPKKAAPKKEAAKAEA